MAHDRGFRFQQAKTCPVIAKLCHPDSTSRRAAFLTLTENRYVTIPGSTKTANCSYIERWAANLKESCDNYEAYLRFHGVSSDEVVEGFTRDEYEKQLRENKEKGHKCYGQPEVALRAQRECRDLLRRFHVSPRKNSCRHHYPQRSRLEPNMKKIIPGSATWISAIAAFFVFSNAPHGFAKPQKKPAGSAQENSGSARKCGNEKHGDRGVVGERHRHG